MANNWTCSSSIYYEYNEDNTHCYVSICMVDDVFSKVDEMLECFINNLEYPFQIENITTDIDKTFNDSAKLTFEFEVPKRCKSKTKEQIQSAYMSAKHSMKDYYSKYWNMKKLGRASIKKVYGLTDQQIDKLPTKINSWSDIFKRDTILYFIDEVESMIGSDKKATEKYQTIKRKAFNDMVKFIVDTEIQFEEYRLEPRIQDKGSFKMIESFKYGIAAIDGIDYVAFADKVYKYDDIRYIEVSQEVVKLLMKDNNLYRLTRDNYNWKVREKYNK